MPQDHFQQKLKHHKHPLIAPNRSRPLEPLLQPGKVRYGHYSLLQPQTPATAALSSYSRLPLGADDPREQPADLQEGPSGLGVTAVMTEEDARVTASAGLNQARHSPPPCLDLS